MLKYSVGVASIIAIATLSAPVRAEDGWLESYNRAMFGFNMQVDKYILKPAAKGYRAITTQGIRNSVNSALSNLKEPATSANHILQGNFENSMRSLARFAINSTLGLGGLFDVAEGWGLSKTPADFDGTMAQYCVPDGPFIIVPILGPSTPRAITGYLVDSGTDPIYWATLNDNNYASKISLAYTAVGAVATRERVYDLLEDLQNNSVDYYSAMRSAYVQNRAKMNSLCKSATAAPDYDFDFDEDFED